MLRLVIERRSKSNVSVETIEEDPTNLIDTPEKLAEAINGKYVGKFKGQPAKGQLDIGDDLFNKKFATIILNAANPVSAFFTLLKKIEVRKQLFLAAAVVINFVMGNAKVSKELPQGDFAIVAQANAQAWDDSTKAKNTSRGQEAAKDVTDAVNRAQRADKIVQNKDISPGAADFIKQIVRGDKTAVLDNSSAAINGVALELIIAELPNTKVESLKMEFKFFGVGGVTSRSHEVLRSLVLNGNIKELDLSGNDTRHWSTQTNNMSDSGVSSIPNIVSMNSNLRKLNLAHTEVFEKAGNAAALANGLRLSVGLQDLNLSNTKLGDKGAIELAGAFDLTVNERAEQAQYAKDLAKYEQMLTKVNDPRLVDEFKPKEPHTPVYFNRSLTAINLSDNNISNIGAKALCEALINNAKLPDNATRAANKTSVQVLDLSGNQISDDKHLRELLKANDKINIKLSGNPISEEKMQALQRDFPGRVINIKPELQQQPATKYSK